MASFDTILSGCAVLLALIYLIRRSIKGKSSCATNGCGNCGSKTELVGTAKKKSSQKSSL